MTKSTHALSVAEFLAAKINQSGKTIEQIADEANFSNPKVIQLITSGATKLPVNQIASLARSLNVEPAALLRIVFGEYLPGLLDVIEDCLGTLTILEGEAALLQAIRKNLGTSVPELLVFEGKQVVAVALA